MSLSLRTIPPLTPELVEIMASGFAMSSILFAAVELRVFDMLEDEPGTADGLAQRSGCSLEGTARLLVALESLGAIRRESDGRYHNLPIASAALTRTAPRTLTALFMHLQKDFYTLFSRLPDAVREGKSQLPAFRPGEVAKDAGVYDLLAKSPADYERFLEAMDEASRGVGQVIASQVDWTHIAHLVDLGHGGGVVTRDILRVQAHLRATAVDLAEACAFAAKKAADQALSERICFLSHDIRSPLPADSADAVLLSGVISDFPPDERSLVLRTAFELLRPGGLLIVSETLFNEDQRGPFSAAMLSLAMLLLTGGDNFTPQVMTEILQAAGFEDVKIHRNLAAGLRDTVLARRPTRESRGR